MSPLLRRLLIVLAVLVLLLGGTAAWLLSSFDGERAKALAIGWMKEHRNRTLAIDGTVELKLFPRLALKASGLRLSEAGSTKEFASLDEAALAVAMLPLLSKSLVIDGVSAQGLRLVYERDAQGRSNIDDLLGRNADANPDRSATAAPERAAPGFDVSRIELRNLHLQVKDALAGIDGEIALESFVSGRLADRAEAPLKLKAQLALQSPALHGSLSGQTRLAIDVHGHSVALRDMALVFVGQVPGASGVEISLQGALGWNSAERTLSAGNLKLEGAATLGALKLGGSSLAVQGFAFDPRRQRMNFDQLALRLQGTATGQPLKLSLDWPQLAITGKTLQGSALSGSVALDGDHRLAATFSSAPPRGDFDNVILPGFKLSAAGTSGSRRISATLAAELALQPAARALDLGKVDLAVQWAAAGSPALSLAAHGDAALSASQARWLLSGQIAGSGFSSQGDAVLSGKVPAVRAQARFDALDLNALLPPRKADAGGPAGGAAGPPGADTPVDLQALRSLNGHLELHAGSLTVRTLRLQDAVLEGTLDNGLLRIPMSRARAWGGRVEARGTADANTGHLALTAVADGVDINAMEQELTGRNVLEGSGRVALNLQTSGRHTGEMKSRLQGTASLQLHDGAIRGFDLDRRLRQARAALAEKRDSSTASTQTEKTAFSALSVSFEVNQGIARSSDLDFRSTHLRIAGDGAIDLAASSIDYTARATPVIASSRQDSSALLAVDGLTVPVHLSGPLDAIQWKVRWSAIAIATVRDQLKGLLDRGPKVESAASGASSPSRRKELTDRLFKGLFK